MIFRRLPCSLTGLLLLGLSLLPATANAIPPTGLSFSLDDYDGLVHKGPIHQGRDVFELELLAGLGGSSSTASGIMDVGLNFRQHLFKGVRLYAGASYVYAHAPETSSDFSSSVGYSDNALNMHYGRAFANFIVPLKTWCTISDIRIEVSREWVGADATANYYKVQYVDRKDVPKRYTLSAVVGHSGLIGDSTYYPTLTAGLRLTSWAAGVFKLTALSDESANQVVEFNRYWYVELLARYGGFGSTKLSQGSDDIHTFSVTASLSGIWLFGLLPICFDIGAAHTFMLTPPQLLKSRLADSGWAFFGMWRFPIPVLRYIN